MKTVITQLERLFGPIKVCLFDVAKSEVECSRFLSVHGEGLLHALFLYSINSVENESTLVVFAYS